MKTLLFIPFLFMCSMVIGQSSKIIGTPIKIGELEVAQNDFPKYMKWNDAKKACADLGSGWRLPTKDELNIMFLNKEKISGFTDYYYWSSTEADNASAWDQNIDSGSQGYSNKVDPASVRAVRAF